MPKFLLNAEGTLGNRNTVAVGSIEHKMGIKGSATCVMNFDGARGWLVGEEGRGLAAMFTMMNYERLSIGLQGLGTADLAFQNALAYAKERRQGRDPRAAPRRRPIAFWSTLTSDACCSRKKPSTKAGEPLPAMWQ